MLDKNNYKLITSLQHLPTLPTLPFYYSTRQISLTQMNKLTFNELYYLQNIYNLPTSVCDY